MKKSIKFFFHWLKRRFATNRGTAVKEVIISCCAYARDWAIARFRGLCPNGNLLYVACSRTLLGHLGLEPRTKGL